MNCNEVQTLISAMLDNELSEEERASVQAHIAACPDCKRMYDAFAALSDSLQDLEAPPADFTETVMRSVRAAAKPPVRKRRWIQGFAAMAACLALILFAGRSLILPAAKGERADSTDVNNAVAPMQATADTNGSDDNGELQLLSFDSATIYQNSLPVPGTEGMSAAEFSGAGNTDAQEAPDLDSPEITEKSVNYSVSNTVPPASLDAILTVSIPADYGAYDRLSDYTVVLTAGEETYTVNIWIDGERLYCEDDASGAAYYAEGTPAQLLTLMEE